MIILLALIACQPAPIATEAASVAPTVVECLPGTATTVEALGPVWSVAVRVPSGALVAPWVQVQGDQLVVGCPAEGGALTVEWGY